MVLCNLAFADHGLVALREGQQVAYDRQGLKGIEQRAMQSEGGGRHGASPFAARKPSNPARTYPLAPPDVNAGSRDAAAHLFTSSGPASVPVVDQVDAGENVGDLAVLRGEDARVAREQESVCLVEVRVDVDDRQRPGHHLAD